MDRKLELDGGGKLLLACDWLIEVDRDEDEVDDDSFLIVQLPNELLLLFWPFIIMC